MSRKPEIVVPPASFVNDLSISCPTVADIQRRCGVSVNDARKLLGGGTVSAEMLEAAMKAFYDGGGDLMIPLQLESCNLSRKRKDKLVSLMRAAAKFVEEYEDILKVSIDERKYWVFPPRDVLLRFVVLREDLRRMLWMVWRQCPSKRGLFFKDTPKLRAQFEKESLDYRIKASAATRKANNKARKAAGKART